MYVVKLELYMFVPSYLSIHCVSEQWRLYVYAETSQILSSLLMRYVSKSCVFDGESGDKNSIRPLVITSEI